jgi:hypothetical protein
MGLMMIVVTIGYSALGLSMILSKDYMDGFVAFTVSAIFAFGIRDTFRRTKSGLAHIISGGVIGGIFGLFYSIEYFANVFDHLINDGNISFKPFDNLAGSIILALFIIIFAIYSKKHFETD